MNELVKFLEESFIKSLHWRNLEEIHIVLGNEAGDLDSVMSAIGYAHFLYSTTTSPLSDDGIGFFPVLNFDRDGMEARLEHKYVFLQEKIDLDKFIYRSLDCLMAPNLCIVHRNLLNFEEMVEKFRKSGKTLNTYLVDHHKLNERDEILNETVCRIFDHRPLDKYFTWTDQNLKMRLQTVASCCTLITHEFFREKEYLVDPSLAYLMSCTIIYDMKGSDNPGTLDEEMKKYLFSKIGSELKPDKIYSKLFELHCKFDHLTPLQILTRDLKTENGILFPRLSTVVADFIKLEGAHSAIEKLCQLHQSDLAVLVGTKRSMKCQHVDIGVLFRNFGAEYSKEFVKKLEAKHFSRVPCEYENFFILKYLGKHIGRKKVLPMVLDVCEEMKDQLPKNEM